MSKMYSSGQVDHNTPCLVLISNRISKFTKNAQLIPLFDVDSGTYYFEEDYFLRAARVDSQAGDAENPEGKHPTPRHVRTPDRRQLLRKNTNTNTELLQSFNIKP